MSQVTHQIRAVLRLCNMKLLGVLLLPPGWDASPKQDYTPVLHLGGERYCESKAPSPRTQWKCPLPGCKPRLLNPETSTLTIITMRCLPGGARGWVSAQQARQPQRSASREFEAWYLITAAWLAQLVERQSAVREVEGSSPRPDQHSGS